MMSLVFISSTVYAVDSNSAQELMEKGKDNNMEILAQQKVVDDLKRQMEMIEASQNFHLGISGDGTYGNTDEMMGRNYQDVVMGLNPEYALENPDKEEGSILSLNINGSKRFMSGLNITSNLNVIESDPFEFNDLEDKYQYSLDVNKRIYPIVPTEEEKNYLSLEKDLKAAQIELKRLKQQKEIDWVEDYLNVIRLQKECDLAQEKLKLAQTNYDQVTNKQKIGEAGEEQLLTAEMRLQDARLNLNQVKSNFEQSRGLFLLELGLDPDNNIKILADDKYINRVKNQLKAIKYDLPKKERNELIKNKNTQLKKLELKLEFAKQELKWQEKADNLKINANGGFEHSQGAEDNNWKIGISFSYDFIDGGEQRLEIEGIQANIDNLQKRYNNTFAGKKLELKNLYDKQQLNKLTLDSRKAGLEKAQLQRKVYKKQLDQGMITQNEFKQKINEFKQIKLDYISARNNYLTEGLKIIQFLDMYR